MERLAQKVSKHEVRFGKPIDFKFIHPLVVPISHHQWDIEVTEQKILQYLNDEI